MAGRKKGFDPLSSLFEIPDPAAGVPLPPIDPPDELDGLHGGGRTFEMTDPFYQAPPGTEVTESVEPPGDFPSEPTQVSMVAPVIDAPAGRVSAFDPPSSPGFAPPDPFPAVPADPVPAEDAAPSDPPAAEPVPEPVEAAGPSDEEKVRIARALVAAAAAKAGAAKKKKKKGGEASPAPSRAPKASSSGAPAPDPAAKPASRLDSLAARTRRPVSALEAARAAAAAEAARAEELAAVAPTEPVSVEPPADGAEPSDAEKARIAKALVASAAAKLKSRDQAPSSTSASGPSDSDKVRIAKAVAAAAAARMAADAAVELSEEVDEAEEEAGSPLDLASRARRPVSALEAARAAAAREDKAKAKKRRLHAEKRRAQARQREHKLTDQIQRQLPSWLPGSNDMYVANAMIIDQREVHQDLWRAHRGNFVAEGELERAVSAVAVLNALEHIGEGQLIAAHVVTDASDYLVWLDLERQGLVAAFSDARAFFAAASAE